MNIRIEWLSDSHECETCGSSWAEGARVFKDGSEWFELEPVAHCFSGQNYPMDVVYETIIRRLGHEVES